jgi:N-acyl homoserine lactone hydrolase
MIKIYAMCCGRLEFDRALFFPDEASGVRFTIPVPSFLIRHDRGTVLFDTGVDCYAHLDPVERLGKRISSIFTLRSAQNENVVDQLASVGLKPDDVTHVINSHFHFDHCGCNALFPRATFIVQRAEMDMARAMKSPDNPAQWDQPFDYRLIDGEHDILGDGTLVLIPTYGHTAGHQSLRVRAAPGVELVLTGDACYSKAHLDREILPAGATWNPQMMIETYGQLRTLQERQGCHLFFGHDPDQWATMRHAPEPML